MKLPVKIIAFYESIFIPDWDRGHTYSQKFRVESSLYLNLEHVFFLNFNTVYVEMDSDVTLAAASSSSLWLVLSVVCAASP